MTPESNNDLSVNSASDPKDDVDVVQIEESARKAQQAGDVARSISLWTQLISLRPDRWEYLPG